MKTLQRMKRQYREGKLYTWRQYREGRWYIWRQYRGWKDNTEKENYTHEDNIEDITDKDNTEKEDDTYEDNTE